VAIDEADLGVQFTRGGMTAGRVTAENLIASHATSPPATPKARAIAAPGHAPNTARYLRARMRKSARLRQLHGGERQRRVKTRTQHAQCRFNCLCALLSLALCPRERRAWPRPQIQHGTLRERMRKRARLRQLYGGERQRRVNTCTQHLQCRFNCLCASLSLAQQARRRRRR